MFSTLRVAGTLAPLLLAGVTGCDQGGVGNADRTSREVAVTRTVSEGPVTLTLTASSDDLDLSEHLQLKLEVMADKSVTVWDIEYDRTLSEGDHQFEYRAVRSEKQLARPTDDGKLRWSYDFELEFFLPGEYGLPAAEVSFVDGGTGFQPMSHRQAGQPALAGAGATQPVQTLATEPITISVRAPAAVMSPEELRNITRLDPIELPGVWSRWWWLAAPIVVVAVMVAALLVRRLRRRRAEMVVHIQPHEWARQQIAALIAEDLIAKRRVQEFYYRISAIVRGYIERRFGVSAPEMTTEEFLTTAADDRRFGQSMTELLNRFLEACDLVKYARHEPGLQESGAVLKAAGDFVDRTRRRATATETEGAPVPPIEERAA